MDDDGDGYGWMDGWMMMMAVSECTELILTDANEKKKVWTRGLSQMKIKNLLEIRDVLIAKICLNQMEMEDCTENLKISQSAISNMEKDKRAKARTGFKQMVTELEQKIKNYNVTIDEQRNKFDGHKAKIEHLEDELRLVDGEIKSLNGQVHLDNPRDRCKLNKMLNWIMSEGVGQMG
jgi:transcriptional regulator with XRE-family HTH domain